MIGGGAREHALVRSLSQDPVVTELACAPGNAGIGALAELLPVDLADPLAIGDLAAAWGAEFVIIEGLGHDLPRALWPEIASRIATLVQRVEADTVND